MSDPVATAGGVMVAIYASVALAALAGGLTLAALAIL